MLLWGAVSGFCRSLVSGIDLILLYTEVDTDNYLRCYIGAEIFGEILFFTLFFLFINYQSKKQNLSVATAVILITFWVVFSVGSFYLSMLTGPMMAHNMENIGMNKVVKVAQTKGITASLIYIVHIIFTVGLFIYLFSQQKKENTDLLAGLKNDQTN
jgi:uncharacterized membrane protein